MMRNMCVPARRLQVIRVSRNMDFRQEFIEFALQQNVLRLASSRPRPDACRLISSTPGCSTTARRSTGLSQFYARAILDSGIAFDVLFGPAYKGIPLVAVSALALAQAGRNVPFAFNRKEAKDHGEGGTIIGAPLAGRVLIVDDVISAGTSVRESVELIRAAGATPCGVVIALDRMERGQRRAVGGTGSRTRLRDAGGRGRDARRPDGLSAPTPGRQGTRSGGRRLSPGVWRCRARAKRRRAALWFALLLVSCASASAAGNPYCCFDDQRQAGVRRHPAAGAATAAPTAKSGESGRTCVTSKRH